MSLNNEIRRRLAENSLKKMLRGSHEKIFSSSPRFFPKAGSGVV